MPRTTYSLPALPALPALVALLALLAPAVASAADAPDIDCSSAAPIKGDLQTYIKACSEKARAERAKSGGARTQAAAAALSVYQSRTTVAGLSFANVPQWSQADILAQFPLQRDNRYLTMPANPSFQRRISWMYPDNGCFARADQFDVKVAAAGKVRPAKLFAFYPPGNLRVYTSNHPNGVVNWWYHVVAVVRNKDNGNAPVVFDPAISPCRPLAWKDWLATMADDISIFNDVAAGNGVALGDSFAYDPNSLVTGEPSHATTSLSEQQNTFLPLEWDRQTELGRDPNTVLGNSPPWSGSACIQPDSQQVAATVAAGATATLTATCPFATLAVGGGQNIPAGFTVSKSVRSGNGWQIAVRNNGSSTDTASVTAICLTGAPTNAQVSTIQGNVVNINANSFATSTAACTNGTLIGGGFSTTQGASSIMRVYANDRTSSTSSTWQASAFNTTSSAKSITAFAYCLPSTSFTFSQASAAGNETSFVQCSPKNAIGGGYSFPRTANYTPTWLYQFGTQIYIVNMSGLPSGGDPNVTGYAECLLHP